MNRMMKAAVTRSPHLSSSVIGRMARDMGVDISSRTVRRRLLKDFTFHTQFSIIISLMGPGS